VEWIGRGKAGNMGLYNDVFYGREFSREKRASQGSPTKSKAGDGIHHLGKKPSFPWRGNLRRALNSVVDRIIRLPPLMY